MLIKLTFENFTTTARDIYINLNNIEYIKRDKNYPITCINFVSGNSVEVREKPEDIFDMIEKMIEDKIGLKDIYLAIENSNRNLRGYHG